MTDLDTIAADYERELSALASAPAESKTPIRHRLAALAVEARHHFVRSDGELDLTGRTWHYRTWIAERYAAVGLSKDERAVIQAALRFHISTVTRQRLSEAELEKYGLNLKSELEKSRDRREESQLSKDFLRVLMKRAEAGEDIDFAKIRALLSGSGRSDG